MKGVKTAEAYIEAHPHWSGGLEKLVNLLRSTELEESIKWGTPHYTLNGRNVIGIAAFKRHFALWFHQGVFLTDPHNLLYNAQEGKTKGLRQIRFTDDTRIDGDFLMPYLLEAIANEKAGLSVSTAKPGVYQMPEELLAALDADPAVRIAFSGLSPGRQKEYAEYISSAKRPATKSARLTKILPMIRQGVGLNDKYRR